MVSVGYPTLLAGLLFYFRFMGFFGVTFQTERGFDERAILGDIVSLMGGLVGFYIAALAAVATFKSDILEEQLKGRPTILRAYREGARHIEKLNRGDFFQLRCLRAGKGRPREEPPPPPRPPRW